MNLKSAMGDMLDAFKIGKMDIDMSYKLESNGSVAITRFSVHPPYTWDNQKEPVYISFNVSDKSITLSSLSYADLKDETLKKFFLLPDKFGDF